ncbi:MAG: hypothetical protein LBR53_06805 [Deltaproteobacteria bacterium]|nr:hypothetical protein [Deltaproteobacteria bacterium]
MAEPALEAGRGIRSFTASKKSRRGPPSPTKAALGKGKKFTKIFEKTGENACFPEISPKRFSAREMGEMNQF